MRYYLLFEGCPLCVWSSCSTQNTIVMRDPSDGAMRLRLFGHTQPVSSLIVLPIASSTSTFETKYQLWTSAGDGDNLLSYISFPDSIFANLQVSEYGISKELV
jgi:hypothetical protein